MARHVVAKYSDIADGRPVIADIGGRSIGVVAANGEMFALRNVCPHQQGPLCEGTIFPAHKASVAPNGDVIEYLDHEQLVICCPWHGWEFDIRTGTCLADPGRRIATYPVSIEGDDVVVEVPDL